MGIATLLQKLAAQQAAERPKGKFYRHGPKLRYAHPSKKGLAKKQAKAAIREAVQAIRAEARQAKAVVIQTARTAKLAEKQAKIDAAHTRAQRRASKHKAKRALPPKNPRIAAIARQIYGREDKLTGPFFQREPSEEDD
jgi:cellobiose-specific phosphotransferase system component IIB